MFGINPWWLPQQLPLLNPTLGLQDWDSQGAMTGFAWITVTFRCKVLLLQGNRLFRPKWLTVAR
jgi:hypothetical protein